MPRARTLHDGSRLATRALAAIAVAASTTACTLLLGIDDHVAVADGGVDAFAGADAALVERNSDGTVPGDAAVDSSLDTGSDGERPARLPWSCLSQAGWSIRHEALFENGAFGSPSISGDDGGVRDLEIVTSATDSRSPSRYLRARVESAAPVRVAQIGYVINANPAPAVFRGEVSFRAVDISDAVHTLVLRAGADRLALIVGADGSVGFYETTPARSAVISNGPFLPIAQWLHLTIEVTVGATTSAVATVLREDGTGGTATLSALPADWATTAGDRDVIVGIAYADVGAPDASPPRAEVRIDDVAMCTK